MVCHQWNHTFSWIVTVTCIITLIGSIHTVVFPKNSTQVQLHYWLPVNTNSCINVSCFGSGTHCAYGLIVTNALLSTFLISLLKVQEQCRRNWGHIGDWCDELTLRSQGEGSNEWYISLYRDESEVIVWNNVPRKEQVNMKEALFSEIGSWHIDVEQGKNTIWQWPLI